MCVYTSSGVNLRAGGNVSQRILERRTDSLCTYILTPNLYFNPKHTLQRKMRVHIIILTRYVLNTPDSKGCTRKEVKKEWGGKKREGGKWGAKNRKPRILTGTMPLSELTIVLNHRSLTTYNIQKRLTENHKNETHTSEHATLLAQMNSTATISSEKLLTQNKRQCVTNELMKH